MQIDPTVINASVKFPVQEQRCCPHCRTPLEEKTNDVMLQFLFEQVTKQAAKQAEQAERQEALALENEELKKMLQDGMEKLRLLKAEKTH